MSRSIHTTRRTLRELKHQKNVNAEKVRNADDSLYTKRRIKRLVRKERRTDRRLSVPSITETIPIEVLDEGKYVHHAASPDDLRAVLAALPESATQGVSRIQLSLGKAYMDEDAEVWSDKRDPFTRRLGLEIIPGVYNGRILGCFAQRSGLISIYAYVYDPGHVPLPLELCRFYLKLRALKTFVHEIAHHHDFVARTARGRWLSVRMKTEELYAERMEHKWTRDVVLPYLARAYPRDTAALRKWVAHRGGLSVDLEFFAGDARTTERVGPDRFFFDTAGAFEGWVAELPRCKSLKESRLRFARQIHLSDQYDECLQIVTVILEESPEWIPALICKADTLVHLKRHDEALAAAGRVLQLEPANEDAWDIQGMAFRWVEKWDALLENCAAWERSGCRSRDAKREMWIQRATAYCGLDRISEMETCLAAHLALFNAANEEVALLRKRAMIRRIFRWAGKPVPAGYLSKPK